MRRAVLLGATMVIMALLAVGIASADPVKSKNAEVFTLDCGGEEVTIVSIFHSNAAVFNVVDGTSNFVATHFGGTFTFTDPESGQTVVEPFDIPVGQGKRTGQEGELTTCATTFFFEDPEVGLVTVDVTVTGFFTPRGR
jgi:hypothetical protein